MTQPLIVGVDEAGRGPWAGPVTAAAVVLGPDAFQALAGRVQDSKALTVKRREALVPVIKDQALGWGLGWSDVDEIDRLGILKATFFAMQRAVLALLQNQAQQLKPGGLEFVVDGSLHPARYLGEEHWPWSTRTMVKADAQQPEVAAASILAKTARDAHMALLAQSHPGFGFETHAGYGTRQHQEALQRLGPSPVHRRSFRPVRELL